MNNREIVQKNALETALKYKRCGLGVSMGVGKTRIAIQHLQRNFDPFIEVLVVIPKKSVSKSWIDELHKMNLEELSNHITFTTYLSINKHDPAKYQIIYLDECHSLLQNHEEFLSAYNGKILGLTGTPPVRKGTEKYRMVEKYCPIKYNFTVDEATENNILNDYQIIVHELLLNKTLNYKKKSKSGSSWYTSELKDYDYFTKRVQEAKTPKQMQFSSIMRMKALMNYPTKENYVKSILSNINSKCIVFANTQEQADKICKHSYHSNNPKSEENFELFSDGRITQLSCVLQLSEGVTIPHLKQGIIMHSYGNERKTAQRIGRLLRLNPTETATCHILCYKGTIDEKWVKTALKSFDENKIKYYNYLE